MTEVFLSPPFDTLEDAVPAGVLLLALAAVGRYGVLLEDERTLTV